MKLQEASLALYQQLQEAWADNSSRMPDADRDLRVLEFLFFEDGGASQWYQVPGHRAWLFVVGIIPGVTAELRALNLDGWAAVKAAEPVVKDILDEFDLRRLTVILPSPLVKIAHAAQQLGFKHEGRLRSSVIYNGRVVDVDIFGLLRDEASREVAPEAPKDPKPKRRRRRSRRSKQRKGKDSAQTHNAKA